MLNAERLIYDLVSIASPSTQESDAVHYLVDWMRKNGYDQAYVDEAGNAVGIIGKGNRDIVLLGHIDTFGGFPPVYIKDRTLYGRGSVDAKGALCTFAAGALQADLPDDVRVVVIGAVEEEVASSKGARYAATQFQPALCIIGEPSGWDRITLGYKGRLLIEWAWRGGLAHSAGVALSAPEHAIAYWEQVRAYVNRFNANIDSVFGQLDATLQAINSGQDGAYGWCNMTIGFRLPPGVNPQQLANDLANENTHAYGCEVAVVSDKNNPLSRALRGAIRAQGGTPRFVYKTGTADMNVVAPIWNCPIVAYGPGDSALDHTPDEHLNLDEYLQAINVLADTLARL
ncbi:MAG: acetyl-lysine deacetylase [Phototrophicales bacterium]|nr:MAG: acetyl-lysine deacetylase [Phototrophicales bacterium]RMG70726.1 MAG: [LysW]-lysine hydrolase [Chloroflexota bacterium]